MFPHKKGRSSPALWAARARFSAWSIEYVEGPFPSALRGGSGRDAVVEGLLEHRQLGSDEGINFAVAYERKMSHSRSDPVRRVRRRLRQQTAIEVLFKGGLARG